MSWLLCKGKAYLLSIEAPIPSLARVKAIGRKESRPVLVDPEGKVRP
jgi:hypothetical protein